MLEDAVPSFALSAVTANLPLQRLQNLLGVLFLWMAVSTSVSEVALSRHEWDAQWGLPVTFSVSLHAMLPRGPAPNAAATSASAGAATAATTVALPSAASPPVVTATGTAHLWSARLARITPSTARSLLMVPAAVLGVAPRSTLLRSSTPLPGSLTSLVLSTETHLGHALVGFPPGAHTWFSLPLLVAVNW